MSKFLAGGGVARGRERGEGSRKLEMAEDQRPWAGERVFVVMVDLGMAEHATI